MSYLRTCFMAAAASLVPMTLGAAPVAGFGQPFIVIDGPDTSGSILDFFFAGAPSGVLDLSLSGTITSAQGAPLLTGNSFSFSSSLAGDRYAMNLGHGPEGTDTGGFAVNLDPLATGPGDLNLSFAVIPPFRATDLGGGLTEFDYLGDYDAFPTRTAEFPEFILALSVFLDAPLPTRQFDDPVFGPTPYFEGPLSIDRIEISTAGGAPVDPVAPVPLPAAGLMLLGALGGLIAARRPKLRLKLHG